MKSKASKTILRGRPALSRWLLTLVTLAALAGMLTDPAGVWAGASQAEAAATLEWTTQRADAPKIFYNMDSHSFKIDKNGAGHVAYGGDHLYYARLVGSSYQIQVVDDSQAVGQFASLALDAQNRPHISYYDAYNGALKYAFFNGSTWIKEVVDTAPAVTTLEALQPSEIDVQADSRPGFDPAFETEELSNAPEGVEATSQDHQGGVGMYSSITIDSQGRPHISYYDAVNRNLKYAYLDVSRNPAVWMVDTVNNRAMGNDYGTWSSIAVTDLGNQTLPLIAYMDETLDDLKFITGKIGSWEPAETVDGGDIKGGYASIALDDNKNIYISYYACGERTSDTNFNCSRGDLKFARRRGEDDWQTVVVHQRDNIGGWTSLAIDSEGRGHISYYSFTDMDLWYAHTDGDVATGQWDDWGTSRLATTGDVGRYSSITLDAKDYPHISYLDIDGGKLVEAYVALDTRNDERWFFRDIDTMADVGYSTSIDFKTNGDPLISYFDNAGKNLKLTKRENGVWMNPPLTLATQGTIGWDTSIEIDGQNRGHVAYYDASKGNLMYTYFNGFQWVTQTVSSYRDIGRYPSLELRDQNTPMISYYDITRGNLMLATGNLSAGTWITETVDTGGDTEDINYIAGQFTSMVLDAGGTPHISYFDASRGALKYATWDPTRRIWINQFVDDDTDDVNPSVLGQYSSIALDAGGVPHISYYECGVIREGRCNRGDLKHAWRVWTGTEYIWQNEVVDTGGDNRPSLIVDVGQYSSLAIRGNQLYISYYDATNGDLRLAHYDGVRWNLYKVDSLGDVGRYSATAIDPSGNPHISYYDATNGDLKMASGRLVSQQLPQGIYYYLPLLGK